MNYKLTNKYFKQNNLFLFIGGGIALVGIIFIMIGFFLRYAGIALLVVAGAMIFISLEAKVKGSEMNEECEKELDSYVKKTLEKYYLDPQKAEYLSFYEYDYKDEDPETFVKGNDGTYRPKYACANLIFIAGEDLYVNVEKFSLIDENDKTEKEYIFKLALVDEIKREEYKIQTKEGIIGRYHTLEINENGKTIILPYPIKEVIVEAVENINRTINKEHKK